MLDGTTEWVDQAAIAEYRDHGVTCVRGAFDPEWILRLNQAATAWA
jgi:hypothetical protein